MLRVNTRQEVVRPGICGIERYGRAEFLESSGMLVEIVPGRAQAVVCVRPVWFEPQGRLEFIGSLPRIAFVFQRESDFR